MEFDLTERSLLGALADQLIPAGEGFPCASEADVAGGGLDRTLGYRPDFGPPLKKLLAGAVGCPPAEYLASLKANDPAGFGVLAELVPGAYFLNPHVRERLGYHGQTPRPIDPHPDYLDDGLLQSVIDRGPIFRPTSGVS